jgi:hypothetical protein
MCRVSSSSLSFPDIFAGNPKFETLGRQPITRYMRLSAFLMLIRTGDLFIPTLTKLRKDDPFESLVPSKTYFRFAENFDPIFEATIRDRLKTKMPEWMRQHVAVNSDNEPNYLFVETWLYQLARLRCIWCWYGSSIESMAQWSLYGSGGWRLNQLPIWFAMHYVKASEATAPWVESVTFALIQQIWTPT